MADSDFPGRFSASQQAVFTRAGCRMLEKVGFLERDAFCLGCDGKKYLNAAVIEADGT